MSKVSFGRRNKHLVSSAYHATRNRRLAEERRGICRRQIELAMIIVERRGDYDLKPLGHPSGWIRWTSNAPSFPRGIARRPERACP